MAFERELREMSFLPRWSTLRRLRTQSLADHSYYVTLYAIQIADLIGWSGDRAALMRAALAHDLPEVTTSDLPGPCKRAVVDPAKLFQYELNFVSSRFPDQADDWTAAQDGEVKRIIKAADLIDEVMYLQTEATLGNANVGNSALEGTPLYASMGRLRLAWFVLPSDDATLRRIWNQHVWPAYQHAGPAGQSRILIDYKAPEKNSDAA